MKLRYIIYSSLTGLLLSGNIQAQEQPSQGRQADELFQSMDYARAAALYEKLVDTKRPRTSDLERLAYSYLYLNMYDQAESWYARAVQAPKASKETYLNYARALQQQGKYVKAREQYQLYTSQFGQDKGIDRSIQGIDSAIVWTNNPSAYVVKNESAVNTVYADFGYFPLAADKGLLTTEPNRILGSKSGMTGHSYLRMYSVERTPDGTLNVPLHLFGDFNDAKYHVGPVAIDAKNQIYYVTRTYPGKRDAQRFQEHGMRWAKQNLELIIYTKEGSGWHAESFPYNDAKRYSLGHASLSEDGKTLYFASDMPGGLGGVDIWYSEKLQDGSWGTPKNAGPEVNTESDEMFPSIHYSTLYFSSNGHIGMGGLDLFKAEGQKSTFSKPVNLRYPLNSAGDDFCFIIAESNPTYISGYLSSNRKGGQGSDDIYSFSLRKPDVKVLLEVNLRNKDNGKPIDNGLVNLMDKNRQIISSGLTDGKGGIQFKLEPHLGYALLGQKHGLLPDSVSLPIINANRDTTIKVTLELKPEFTKGDRFVLEDIHYDLDKYFIRKDAAVILDRLVKTMKDHPSLKIELSSHTDSRGSARYNEVLSQNRAQAAVDYIVSQGISRNRLIAKGYGETRLTNRCADGISCTEQEHQANRRTEVEILEF
ncbi:OmpA family protein [Sphingobacterium faecale]|uniref:OmpA family protein n=1 Tax=Sphingobacterium faecale TaxID=2803775 RepID=A0ABS1R090_9SPHI|nr:OmpA family protein [Sphingobacterium faecale]MBL1408106.1 OmpA family protein [Sphingobacterium faecale]